jgi:hypothetical protein
MPLLFVLARDEFLGLDWRAFLDLLFGEVNGDQFNQVRRQSRVSATKMSTLRSLSQPPVSTTR